MDKNYQCKICGHFRAKSEITNPKVAYFRCLNCGTISQYPLPEKDITLLYEKKSYFDGETNKYVKDEEIYRRNIHQPFLKEIMKFKKKGKLLEVGCGIGTFLEEAKKTGWEVLGIEVSPWATGYCRESKNLEVHLGTLEDAPFDKGSFDFVVFNHVIEHLLHPVNTLSLAKEYLNNSGILVTAVPNYRSIQAKIRKENWFPLMGEHLYQFTPKTLKKTLEQSGFRVISIIGNSYFGRKGFDLFLGLLKDRFLLGNSIIAFAEK